MTTDMNFNYNDFSSFDTMRADARRGDDATLQQVAKQFESMFVQMMIKSMREASVPLQGELFHSDQEQAYQDMHDKQLGLELVKGNGLGLADVIVRQLSKQMPGQQPTDSTDSAENIATNFQVNHSLSPFRLSDSAEKAVTGATVSPLQESGTVEISKQEQPVHWASAEDFIRDSWPHAERAGRELGIDPRVILAQSALETGWGKRVHYTENGENSYCLFGIKADQRWDGNTVAFDTLEFRQGVVSRENARFRAYDSIAAAYDDYVEFLQQHPRYRQVLAAETPEQYARALREAGYATDPLYDQKIERIRQSDLMNNTLSLLKDSGEVPLT